MSDQEGNKRCVLYERPKTRQQCTQTQTDQTCLLSGAMKAAWMAWVEPVKVCIHTDISTLLVTHTPVKTSHSFSVFLSSTKAAY